MTEDDIRSNDSKSLNVSKIQNAPFCMTGIGAVVFFGLGAAHAQSGNPSAQQTPKSALVAPSEKAESAMKTANPQMQAVLDKLAKLGAKPLGSQSVAETRRGPSPADAVKAVLVEQGKDPSALIAQMGVKTQETSYPTVGGAQNLRIYTPTVENQTILPVIVYFHGGGWVIADLDTYDASARGLAQKTGAIVASVEYRRAPENHFPAAHDDSVAAYRWVVQNAASFGGDAKRIAVAGESAGGNLAINVAIAARDQQLQAPLHVLLVYPVAGTDMTTPSYNINENAVPLGKRGMAWFVSHVLAKPSDAKDTRLALVGAANVAGLPPTTVIAAEIDPLLSEGKALADKLAKVGVVTTYTNFPGVAHEFFGMAAVVADADTAQELAAAKLREAFSIDGRAAQGGIVPERVRQ